MRQLLGPVLLVFSIGCAQTPNLRLRVEATRTARLAPEVLRQLEGAHATSLRENEAELERARQRVANARRALDVVRAEPVIPEGAEVHAAKLVRADSELKWEQSLLHAAEWRRASTASIVELAKAETLSRAGENIDVPAYAEQRDRIRVGLAEAVRQQAAMRAQFDDSERRLSAAKAHYAQRRAGQEVGLVGPSRQ